MLDIFNAKKLLKADIISILLISLLWIVMTIIVNPLGNFPLNDDWAYGKAVQSIIEKGSLQILDWTPASQVAQILWGTLFCLPFGFSFTSLRLSTLTLGLVGTLATYGCLREVKADSKIALIGALLIAANPLYFQLSNTFMTDVPFLAFSILSFYFFLRGVKNESNIDLVFGTLFTCLATLTRQFGVVTPLAFGFAFLIKIGISKQNIIKAFTPTLITIGVLAIYQTWLQSTNNLPTEYSRQAAALGFVSFSLRSAMERTTATLAYIGLFLLPFEIMLLPNKWKQVSSHQRLPVTLTLTTFTLVTLGGLKLLHKRMPLLGDLGNILFGFGFGLGPATLKDGTLHLPNVPRVFWIVITVVSVISAGFLLLYLFSEVTKIFQDKPENKRWLRVFTLLNCNLYFLILIKGSVFFDRYLIFFIPLLMIVIVNSTTQNYSLGIGQLKSNAISISLVLIVVLGGFTVGATHDYLAWNRVRWHALSNLMQEAKVSAHEIDGGFEFNGWYLYNPEYQRRGNKSWWWVDRDNYLVTFGPVDGYKEVKRYSFKRWIPFGEGSILVLHKRM